ncbi:hypothetical protein DNU06_11660 [Putridiphycobacter roseus]|uniref:Mucoidy inhibitor MuiA family protein n=1 Tax=Putridiphycobacter roseus TaxID=2219161 RepID=A0A2W1NCU4_9FLAO|nr:DUF4139 domain-containing protein [Putridiphycobacter roseus]PZE16903.1 hypothetical protein DNU06_11660 [Putridiphycobacter roseus]
MKNISLFLLCCFPLYSMAATEKTIKSTIQKVTVYQQGAQIHRKAYFSIKSGTTKIILEGISPQIDQKSIQVQGTGEMTILDSKYTVTYPKPIPQGTLIPTPKMDRELYLLNDSIFEIDYLIMANQHKLNLINSQISILTNNGAIKGIGKVNDSIPLLRDAMDFHYLKMNTLNLELLSVTKSQALIQKTKNRINQRINELNEFKRKTQFIQPKSNAAIHKLVVTLISQNGTNGRLNISYLVKDAGWTPLYDIRSNSTKSNVDLTYKAQVRQNTGVNWENIPLTLSTTNPYTNKTKPTLSPYYVNFNRPVPPQYNLNEVQVSPTRTGKKINLSRSESMEEDEVAISADYAYNHTVIQKQLIAVNYDIGLPYTIESNNEVHMVLVRKENLKTDYRFYTVPKLDPSAYLIAELSDLGDLNLIPGNATIFHDGTYLGETYINPNTMADSLALSLGKDQNIQVKRTLLKDDSKTRIIGDKTLRTYAYLIEIKNQKSSTLNIKLQDQIPVAQTSEITIEAIELSKGKLNEVTGIIDWNLKLKAKETKTIKLTYTVSHSKTKQLNLAQY